MKGDVKERESKFLWLSRGDMKVETESEIIAAQDQATKILKTETANTKSTMRRDRRPHYISGPDTVI
jgi:hypothetical protein